VIGAAIRNRIMDGLVARDIWRAGPETCWRRLGELLDALEGRAPEDGYWLGSFSLADIGLFGILHSLRTPLTPRQHQQVDSHSRLKRYLDRVDAATREPRAQGPELRVAAG
jgi:glutathione S-transferase